MTRTRGGAGVRGAVELVEVGPRDGLQNEAELVATPDKLALVRRSVAAGLHRVEVTSFVRPDRVPQLADAEEVVAGSRDVAGLRASTLVVNRRGLDRALAAGVPEVNLVVVATDTFSLRNQGRDVDTVVAETLAMARTAHDHGRLVCLTVAVAFGCPFEGEVPAARVVELAERLAPAEAEELSLADTVGVAVPDQVEELFAAVAAVGDARLRTHFHNTRNLGSANVLAAARAGARVFDVSTGGIGGCPFAPRATGNVATEDAVYALERSGWTTGVDLAAVSSTAAWLGERLGRTLPGLLGRAGDFPDDLAAAAPTPAPAPSTTSPAGAT